MDTLHLQVLVPIAALVNVNQKPPSNKYPRMGMGNMDPV